MITKNMHNHNLTKHEKKAILSIMSKNRQKIMDIWYRSQFDPALPDKYTWSDSIKNQNFDWLLPNYFEPMFKLLTLFLKTGKDHFLNIYLDEKLRFAPALPFQNRNEFFEEVLSSEEKAFYEELDVPGKLKGIFFNSWRKIHEKLIFPPHNKSISLLAVGDCLMNELRTFLTGSCKDLGINLDMRLVYFSATLKADLSIKDVVNYLNYFHFDMIALSFFTYSALPFYTTLIEQTEKLSDKEIESQINNLFSVIDGFIHDLREYTGIPILLHNTSGLLLSHDGFRLRFGSPHSIRQKQIISTLNNKISEIVNNSSNILLIDEHKVHEQKGAHLLCKKLLPSSGFNNALIHTRNYCPNLVDQYTDIFKPYSLLSKIKVIFVDFDNTLWDGIMADGEVKQRVEEQNLLLKLKEAGILLVAASKNDIKNIRWNEMVLKESDFVLLKINWNRKAQSIKECAGELNLGTDSFLLLDDNPVERELVKNELPSVKTLDSQESSTWSYLKKMLDFPNTNQTDEANKRTALYRSQIKRKETLTGKVDYRSMMMSLELKVNFLKAKKKHLNRISELVERTNQFNTTTMRYTQPELKGFLTSSNHQIYVTELEDKFGKLGIVGVVIIERQKEAAVFDTFIMSCRAMGFGLENLMLGLSIEVEGRTKNVIGKFIPTDRNTPAKDLFYNNSFIQSSGNEWILDKDTPNPEKPTWFTVTTNI